MTETSSGRVDDAQRQRLEALQRRSTSAPRTPQQVTHPESSSSGKRRATPRPSSSSGKRRGRSHVAAGGRIAAAGIGASGLLGIVTVLGVSNPPEQSADPADTGPPEPVAVTARASGIDSAMATTGTVSPSAATESAKHTPIVLTANPVVRTVIVQPPPVVVSSAASAAPPPVVVSSAASAAPPPVTAAPTPPKTNGSR